MALEDGARPSGARDRAGKPGGAAKGPVFDVRTNDFASVSGYFHVDRIFRTMQDLGFDVGTYMANTVFPIPVDIRCTFPDGTGTLNTINAHCVGDGAGFAALRWNKPELAQQIKHDRPSVGREVKREFCTFARANGDCFR
jgi:hypothetical protein